MKTYDCIVKAGRIVCPELDKDLKECPDGSPIVIDVERTDQKKRSVWQNRYLFGVPYKIIARFYFGNIKAFIMDLMKAIKAEVTVDFVHELCKMLFNKGKSTRGMSTVRFNEYFTDIREYYYHEYGLDIPEPNQPPASEDNA